MKKHFRRDNHIAMATKQGKYQIQRVTYNSDGIPMIQPLTAWLDIDTARAEMERIAKGAARGLL